MSDGKMTTKKLMKKAIKLIVPLILVLGIVVVIIYLFITYPPYSSNVFMLSLNLWLTALDINLAAIVATYATKDILRSPITGLRLKAIRNMKLITIAARIFTVIGIATIGLVLVTYLIIYLRAVASGLTKIPAFLTSQQAILLLLLLIVLLPLVYIVKRETEKVIRLGTENVMIA